MKKSAILLFALLVSFTVFPQKRQHRVMGWKISKDIPQNEVKLNLGNTIIWTYPEISYERIVSEDFSFGASLGVNIDSDIYPVKFGLMPYARWFFGGSSKSLQKYGAGFFIEANGALLSQDTHVEDSSNSSSEFGAGLGLALGWKYLSRNNWVGEIYYGAGRVFVNDGFYPRVGITIGKRF